MKYIVLLCDGMADWPLDELGGKTPMEAAFTPHMDALAEKSVLGLVKTVPDGLPAGSDVANLSVFGFNPLEYYSGRSPLEAISMGVRLSASDIAMRLNLVTLSDPLLNEATCMKDYCAGEITTAESHQLIEALSDALSTDEINIYPGISYRHCLVWKNGPFDMTLTPPHDISGQAIAAYLPKGEGSQIILDLTRKSIPILADHPVNQKRIAEGKNPANAIWLWGQGKKPSIPLFVEKYGICGSVISAVDLIKGIGMAAGLKSVEVEGATGNLHTNYKGKALAALKELNEGRDFVYLHVEAPDECGHQGQLHDKITSIERIDHELLGTLLEGLGQEEFSLLILPDHPTPLAIRTHSREPVPYMIYRSGNGLIDEQAIFSESYAKQKNNLVSEGYTLMDLFLSE